MFAIILVTLSTLHPCQPFHMPQRCSDFITRAETFNSQSECERSWQLAFWKRHIAEIIRNNTLNGVVYGDTGAAVCAKVQP